jgi:hypothetical protein
MTALEHWRSLAPSPRPLTVGDTYHVFLSYRSVNRPWVINLYDVLQAHGYEVFLDQVRLIAGAPLVHELESGLEQSQNGMLIWSSAAADSDWVREEYQVLKRTAAEKHGFRFIPLKLDARPLPGFAANHVHLDFSGYPDGPNGGELLRLLHAVAGEPLSREAATFAAAEDEAARMAAARIDGAVAVGDSGRLLRLFREGGLSWETSSALGAKVAQGLLELDEIDASLEVLAALSERFPRALRPQQLRALALVRRGGPDDLGEAQALLSAAYSAGERDPETVGIYARTWMDRYAKSGNRLHLERSRDLYAEAFAGAADDYYTGVNAAAKSVLLGDEENLARAARHAEQVQACVGTEPVAGDYWRTATVAELFLIRRDYASAGRTYDVAVSIAPDALGNHRSSWTQACRLMASLRPTEEERSLVRRAFDHLPDPDPLAP